MIVFLLFHSDADQGCQMDGLFSNQKSQFGKIWKGLRLKIVYVFLAIWNILQTLGKFYVHLVHFVFIWYIFPVLVSCTMKYLATLM
jgi:hypothetical protein